MRTLPPAPAPSRSRRIITDVHEIIRAREDSAARRKGRAGVLVRRAEPIDSGVPPARGRLNISGERVTMLGDGREWNDLEMRNQHVTTSRDSLFRERVRATRERNDARRAAGKNP